MVLCRHKKFLDEPEGHSKVKTLLLDFLFLFRNIFLGNASTEIGHRNSGSYLGNVMLFK